MDSTKNITLKHLLIDQNKCIGLQFSSSKVLQLLVDALPNISWSREFEMHYLPNNKSNLDLIFKTFYCIAWVNGNYFFSDKIINADNPQLNLERYRNRIYRDNYKFCPEDYLLKLELKKYFKGIYIVTPIRFQSKYNAIKNILSDNKYDSKSVLIVGNRLDKEIRAGNNIGVPTL